MIGIFDSGVGGLTVVKEVFRQLPGHEIIYFGDTARLPYGTKGADFVRRYSEKITEWLLDKGAKIIIIACNTSSAWAADYLRQKFPGIPIFEMIKPTAELAVLKTKNDIIGVIGTPGTIKSSAYSKKLLALNPDLNISLSACPLFVPLVEEGMINEKATKEIAERYLAPIKESKADTLILGCTHYPLMKDLIEEIMGKNVCIVNSAEAVAEEVKNFLKENPGVEIKKGEKHQFFFSDEPYNFEKISRLCFQKEIKPEIIDPF